MVHSSRFAQAAAVAILSMLSMCASAQAQLFSPAKNVSNNTDFAMTPQVGVDAAGNINVAWEDDTASSSYILFSRSTDGGNTFSAATNLSTTNPSNSLNSSFNPRIAVESNGAIDVVWLDYTSGNQVVYFSRSTDGVTFSPAQSLSDAAASASSPQIGVDASGNISVLWESDSGPVGILFTHSTDGVTFAAPKNLTSNTTGSIEPQMVIEVDGSINVVWEEDFNFQSDISFSRSTDKGANFSAPRNLSANGGNSFGAQVAVDLGGNISVVWTDDTPGNNDIFFTRSTDHGATFSGTKNLSNSPGDTGSAQVGVDANGNIFVAWQDNVPPAFKKDVYFSSSSDGSTFSGPANLSNNQGNSINAFMNVDAGGGINLVWMDNTPGKSNLFFTRSTDSGATFTTQNLSSDSGSSSDGQVASDKNGNLNVMWSDDVSGVNQIWFSRYTAPQATHHPPVAKAVALQSVECAGPGGTQVTLDGSGSYDPDGTALTYMWVDQSTTTPVGMTAMVPLTMSLGVHTFTLTVTNAAGLSASASTTVTIQDTMAPTLSVSVSPNYLWPPNHKLIQITATVAANDVCDARPSVQLVSITNSDGNDPSDVQAAGGGPIAFGTDVRSFLLKAERNYSARPRVYTVSYRATDASGHLTAASAQVQVSDTPWNAASAREAKKHKPRKEHER